MSRRMGYQVTFPSNVERDLTGWIVTIESTIRGHVWAVKVMRTGPIIVTRDGAVQGALPAYVQPLLRNSGRIAGSIGA